MFTMNCSKLKLFIKNKLIYRNRIINLPPNDVKMTLDKYNVSNWFFYIFTERHKRWDIWAPSLWVLKNVGKNNLIFETGCGCGFNLIWFAQKGFTNLAGSDISLNFINTAKDMFLQAGYTGNLWVDDGLEPAIVPENIDTILALNWTFLLDSFSLDRFLKTYSNALIQHGRVIIDIIDTAYDKIPDNQYQTADWNKPEEMRRPTEYKVRYSRAQVENIAMESGYKIRHTLSRKQLIPKTVYILQKV